MKKSIIIFLVMLITVGIYGCETGENNSKHDVLAPDVEEKVLSHEGQREIVDLGGNVVKLPSAEKLNRVVIISPPIASIQYGVLKDTSNIVATHPLTFKNANPQIIKKIFKNFDGIDTSFIKGFSISTESVLNLKPDIIFYYGQQQKKGLESLNIPMVDFMKPKDRDPVAITTEWERLIRDIYQVEDGKTIKEEWEKIDKELSTSLEKIGEGKLKGLMIFNNNSNKIVVSGNNTYGDYWLEMSGLVNVADNIIGEKEVSMEQIYQFNPDIIYVFMGEPAMNYLKDINGQDWSKVNAVKENRIYDVPEGIFSWGAPNADSPLMIHWMMAKNYPSYFNKDKLINIIKEYYDNHYNITLTDEMLDSIVEPNKERE